MNRTATDRLLQQAMVNSLHGVREALADRTVEVNGRDREGRTALMSAATHQNIEMLKALLAAKADVNVQDPNGWSALHLAVQQANAEEVTMLLIASGASLAATDSSGNTPLWRALFACKGQGDVPGILLRSRADPDTPNHRGVSPRQLADRIANYDLKKFFKS